MIQRYREIDIVHRPLIFFIIYKFMIKQMLESSSWLNCSGHHDGFLRLNYKFLHRNHHIFIFPRLTGTPFSLVLWDGD